MVVVFFRGYLDRTLPRLSFRCAYDDLDYLHTPDFKRLKGRN